MKKLQTFSFSLLAFAALSLLAPGQAKADPPFHGEIILRNHSNGKVSSIQLHAAGYAGDNHEPIGDVRPHASKSVNYHLELVEKISPSMKVTAPSGKVFDISCAGSDELGDQDYPNFTIHVAGPNASGPVYTCQCSINN